MNAAADVFIDHANTAVENWLLIGAGAAFLAIALTIAWVARAVRESLLDAAHERALVAAHERSAIETWCQWLPTRESVAVILTKLEAGEFHVLPPPVSIKRRRLAAVARRSEVAA